MKPSYLFFLPLVLALLLTGAAGQQCLPTEFDCIFRSASTNATCKCVASSITTTTVTQVVTVSSTATTLFCTLVVPVTSTSVEVSTITSTSTVIIGTGGEPVGLYAWNLRLDVDWSPQVASTSTVYVPSTLSTTTTLIAYQNSLTCNPQLIFTVRFESMRRKAYWLTAVPRSMRRQRAPRPPV